MFAPGHQFLQNLELQWSRKNEGQLCVKKSLHCLKSQSGIPTLVLLICGSGHQGIPYGIPFWASWWPLTIEPCQRCSMMFGFGQGIMPRSDKRGADYVFPHIFAVVLQLRNRNRYGHLQSCNCTHRQFLFRLSFCSEMFGIMMSWCQ